MNKIFLLVFHGGLVAYLVLHNLLLPLIKNIGYNNFIFSHLQYYFFPQLILFLSFWFKRKIEFSITINLTILIASFTMFSFKLKDGISANEFSILISLASIFIFFFVFFLHFYKFFNLNFITKKKQSLIGLTLGLLFTFLHSSSFEVIEQKANTSAPQPSPSFETIKLNLPQPLQNKKNEITINSNGFDAKYFFLSKSPTIKLKNRSHKKHLLRVEYIKNNRWYFKKIITILSKKNQKITIDAKGIYRLRSPSSKEIGIVIIIKNSHLFKPGIYQIDKKGIRIK